MKESSMKNQLPAAALALTFVTGVTTGATAFERGGFHSGSLGGVRGGLYSRYDGFRGDHGRAHDSNLSGIRGFASWRNGGWGSRRSVGDYGG
jgi:hypothetical protein